MLSGYFSYLIITDYNGELAKYVLQVKIRNNIHEAAWKHQHSTQHNKRASKLRLLTVKNFKQN